MLLLRPDCDELKRQGEIEKLNKMRSAGGATELEVTQRGLLPNAYAIQKFPDAYQVQFNMLSPPATVKAMLDYLATPTVDDDFVVIRYSCFKQ